MSVAHSVRRNMSFGGRLPPEVGGLILVTAVLSIIGAVAGSFGQSLVERCILLPSLVWAGEVWRLVTWVLFEVQPIGFLFGLLMLYLFGRDLSSAWGARRFLGAYFALAASTAAVVTLAERLLFPSLGLMAFSGVLSITAGLVIAWGLTFPDRQLYVYMILPLSGQRLVWITLGITSVFALFARPMLVPVLPEVVAELLALGWMYRGRLVRKLRALRPRKPPRKPPTDFQVWDEEKQRFRPPKWMN